LPDAWRIGRSGCAGRGAGATLGDTAGYFVQRKTVTSSFTRAYACTYDDGVSFEWDPDKARANARKHRIEFADAVAVFEDASAVTISDDDSTDEERWVTIGQDSFDRLLVVIYTWRGTNIRLISARKASRREQREYRG
jgi:hypothetical protein